MKVRRKDKPEITGVALRFNMHGLGEIIVGFNDGDMDSQPIKDFQVYLESTACWLDMSEAFKTRALIPDNYNQFFGEPRTPEEKERGYFDV